MRALVYKEDHTLEVREVPVPTPGAEEVVLRVESAGICGSDVQGVATRSPRRQPPLIMGHELTGQVVAEGRAALPRLLGQRVAVNPQVPCGACLACRSGGENVCTDRELIGGTRAGGFGEFVSVPARCLHPISEHVAAEIAVLAEPLATCVHAFRLVSGGLLGTVIVLGAGTIGILAAKVANLLGAHRVIVSEPDEARHKSALAVADAVVRPDELGEVALDLTCGRGADVTVDAVGSDSTRRESVDLLAPRGTALWLGMHDQEATIHAFDVVVREQRIQGSFAYTNVDFARAVQLLERDDGQLAVSSQSFSLEESVGAFEGLLRGQTDDFLKAVVTPKGSP